jgi:hypothetical protein
VVSETSSAKAPVGGLCLQRSKVCKGRRWIVRIYSSLLADRVQSTLESEEDPESALDQMYEAFYEEDLADGDKPSIDQVGSKLIDGNLSLWEHFSFLGLPGSLPDRNR